MRSSFDLTTVGQYAGGFTGCVFDGRYVYFIPASGSTFKQWNSVVTRYDTQADFSAATAWSSFDTKALSGNNVWAFGGGAFDGPALGRVCLDPRRLQRDRCSSAAFDGQYIYRSPGGFGPALRFDARDAAPVSASVEGGSFY